MPENPVDTGDSRPRLSVVDAWLSPMSTTVREEYEVGDLDPVGVLEAAADGRTSRTTSRVPQAPARRPLGRPPPRHRRHRQSRRSVAQPFSPTSHSAATAPRPWRRSPPNRSPSPWACPRRPGPADRRRPRPAPPPPILWKRLGPGSKCRPGRPAASPDRPTGLSKAAAIWVDEQLADRDSCGPVVVDRLVAQAIAVSRPRGTRRPGERREGRLGRHPHPPRGHRLPRHLTPRSHRRHPHPEGLLRPGPCDRPPAVRRRRPRPPRRSQDQGHRHRHGNVAAARQPEGQGLCPGRHPEPRTRHPRRG